jgi:hypothetical protein
MNLLILPFKIVIDKKKFFLHNYNQDENYCLYCF